MKVTTEELERCEVLLTLEIEPEQQEKLLKKAAQRIAREVKIPGFRPGKAPYNVVVRRFGLEVIQKEALEESVEKLITDGLAEVKVTPFAQIKPESVEWQPALAIKVRVPTRPVVELGDYRDIRLEAEPVEITEEDVDQALKYIQQQRGTWTPVERPAQLGDMLSMAVTEKDGDEILSDHEAVEYELTELSPEAAQDQPDMTTPLLGMIAGESKTFSITYPETSRNSDYAGKEITFEVEVSGVKQKELDPLDDEFAKQIGDFETLDLLKERIRADIKGQRQAQYNMKLGQQALEKIIENAEKIEWPLAYEDEQVDHEVEHFEHHLKEAGLTLTGYLNVQGKTQEQMREEFRENVVKQLKQMLAMGKLAELEKLGISQIEVLQHAKFLADMSGAGDQIWQSVLSSESRQAAIANDLLTSKVMARLAVIAKGEADQPEAAEAEAESSSVEPAAEVVVEISAESNNDEAPAEVVDETSTQSNNDEAPVVSVEAEADEATKAEADESVKAETESTPE